MSMNFQADTIGRSAIAISAIIFPVLKLKKRFHGLSATGDGLFADSQWKNDRTTGSNDRTATGNPVPKIDHRYGCDSMQSGCRLLPPLPTRPRLR